MKKLIIILIFSPFFVFSQNIVWEKYLNKDNFNIDSLNSISASKIINIDNYFYIGLSGYTNDGRNFPGLLKLDNNSNIEWCKTLLKNNPNDIQILYKNNDGNLVILSSFIKSWEPGFFDANGLLNTIIYSTAGNLIYDFVDSSNQKAFPDPGSYSIINNNILGTDNFYNVEDSIDQIYVKRYNLNGVLQNENTYSVLPSTKGSSWSTVQNSGFIMQTIDNGSLTYGYITIDNSNQFPFITKYDENFNYKWSVLFNNKINRNIMEILQKEDSTFFVIGWYLNSTLSRNDSSCFIWKLDKNGNIIKEKYFYGRYFSKIQFVNDNILLGSTVEQYPFGGSDTIGLRILYLNSNFDFIIDYVFHNDTVYKTFSDFSVNNDKILLTGSYNYYPYIAEIGGILEASDVKDQITNNLITNISPNPFEDMINIDIGDNLADIEIYNVLGVCMEKRKVSNSDTQNGKISINTSDYSPGLYIVNIIYGDKSETHKIIKN